MSNPITQIDHLAARARQSLPPPESSIAPAVLCSIQSVATPNDRPLWWFAAGSAAAAVCVVTVNLSVLAPGTDATELAMYAGWMML